MPDRDPPSVVVHRVVRVLVIGAVVAIGACESEATNEVTPTSDLVGTWLVAGGRDNAHESLRLNVDGTATGTANAIDPAPTKITRWKIGTPLMPGGFCVGGAVDWFCQGFRLVADTLSLADQAHTRLVRVRDNGAIAALPLGDSGRRSAVVPAPGDFIPRGGR